MAIFNMYFEGNADRICQQMAGQGSSRPPPGSMICSDSQDLSNSCICSYNSLYEKDTKKKNQQREKAHEEKARGNQELASKSPFPTESHRMCLIPPALNCDNMCEMLSTRKLIRE